MKHTLLATALLLTLSTLAAAEGFELKDTSGDHLDVLLDGKIVGRYMYACDKSTNARRQETYKPYLHIFDPEGKAPITKGPGGQYTHHRGIFIGWIKIGFNNKIYDRWSMGGKDTTGEQVHQKFLKTEADASSATLTALTHWNDETGKPMVVEERTMRFTKLAAPGRVAIDFAAKLTAPNGDVQLNGDPEHGGVQYRPAEEGLDKVKLTYVFPKENADPHKDFDMPWVGETYTLNGQTHSVVIMNHPGNPKPARWSAYRDYGRFGAFFVSPIKSGESLTVQTRFLIAAGPMLGADIIQKSYDQFAGLTTPSPVPALTTKGPEKSAAPATKPAAKPKPVK